MIAQNADGTYVRLNASKGVILCTGDYGSNKEMVAKYGSLLPGMVATSLGEGHQMGMWVGGVMENQPHCPMSHSWSALGQDAWLYVNKFGKRFYNEDSNPEAVANQAYEQGGFWCVLDDSWAEDVGKMGLGFFRIWNATATVKKEFDAKVTAGTTLKSNTLDDLAAKMKVPADALKATVARYNELCKGGKDLDFAKRSGPVDAHRQAAILCRLDGQTGGGPRRSGWPPGEREAAGRRRPGRGHPGAVPGRKHGWAALQGRLSGDLPRA